MPLPGAEETNPPKWYRASYCASGECVEVAWQSSDGVVLMRDSKRPAGGTLSCTPAQWRSLLAGIKTGQYSHLSR